MAGKVPVFQNGKAQGAYARHVADESVKARVNLYRDPGNPKAKTLAQKRALLAGHRPDPSVMKSPTGVALDFLPKDDVDTTYAAAAATTAKVEVLFNYLTRDAHGCWWTDLQRVEPGSVTPIEVRAALHDPVHPVAELYLTDKTGGVVNPRQLKATGRFCRSPTGDFFVTAPTPRP